MTMIIVLWGLRNEWWHLLYTWLTFKKCICKKYICLSVTTNGKKVLWGVTIFCISKRIVEIEGLIISKEDYQKSKIAYKVNEGGYFGEVYNGQGKLVE